MNDCIETIESEIKVLNYIWKSQIFVTGHYQFEIQFTKRNVTNPKSPILLSQKTIYRRFSDFEILYKGLIELNPGCLTPKIPEKNFWANFSFSKNDTLLTKRMKNIENYLNYINKHYYLSQNPVYKIFISDDFERFKSETTENTNFIKLCQNKLINIFPKLKFDTQINRVCDFNEENIKKEKIRLQKMEKGAALTSEVLKELLDALITKAKALKQIAATTQKLKESNFKLEMNSVCNEFVMMKSNLSKEVEMFNFANGKINGNIVKMENLFDNITHFQIIVNALIDIFYRKEALEFELKKECNEDFLGNDIEELKIKVKKANKEFIFELNNFQENIEKNYMIKIKEFITMIKDTESEIRNYMNV